MYCTRCITFAFKYTDVSVRSPGEVASSRSPAFFVLISSSLFSTVRATSFIILFLRTKVTTVSNKKTDFLEQRLMFCHHVIVRVRISSTFSVLRPFSDLRPFLYFDRSTSTSLLRPLYFDSCTSTSELRTLYLDLVTSTSVLRTFVKSGFLIGREAQVEVKFGQKGRSKV